MVEDKNRYYMIVLSDSRELLSGVDTLKNVAEILQFIDRISEMKQH